MTTPGLAGRALPALRRADWLSADRARAYGGLLCLAVLIFLVAAYARILLPALSDPGGRVLGSDFTPFWSGARLALAGHPGQAYDLQVIQRVEESGAQTSTGLASSVYPYLYPPIWMMLCLPFALLPYVAGLAAFQLGGYAALIACLRPIWPKGWTALTLFAFPAFTLNAVIGQNGFATASCFAAAMLWLDRHPWRAGACLGLLAFKPHIALGVPVCLVAGGRWQALAACGGTAIGLAILSWLVLGQAAWAGFAAASPFIGSILHDPGVWPKLVSVFTAARFLGAGSGLALAVQAGVALAALWCVWRAGRARPGGAAEVAVTTAAATLCTPYLMDYDLVCLAVPLTWLAGQAMAGGWRPWEKSVAAGLYVYPLMARGLNLGAGLPLTPLLLAGLLAVMMRRCGARRPA